MKRILLTISLFVFSLSVIVAQQTHSNQTDNQGRKQGFWKKYNGMGYLRYEGHFEDDIPVGEFKYYYPNGNIRTISMMSDNGDLSRSKLYHRNGKLMAEGKYFKQSKDSIWNYYSENFGILLSTETYVNTVKQGVWKTYYPSGVVAEEINYSRNAKNGSWKKFHTESSLKLEGTYVNDIKEGSFKLYHPDGQLELLGTYKEGFQNGVWTQFDKYGVKLSEKEYDMGKLVSEKKF